MLNFHDLQEIAETMNLSVIGFTNLADINDTLEISKKHLYEWQNSGYAGEMKYMQRSPDFHCDVGKLMSAAKSILTFCVPYYSPDKEAIPNKAGYGRIAKYAWGLDYHQVLNHKLEIFMEECKIRGLYKDVKFRTFSDSVPIPERSLAGAAGHGFIGKSSMLIRPGFGTYFFICEIIIDKEITSEKIGTPQSKSSCGSCRKCRTECPTNAIVEDKTVDARKCISYLTIEKKTPFNDFEMEALGSWLFGCDICQEVCPFNNKGVRNEIPDEFKPSQGVGPNLSIADILSIHSDDAFKRKFVNTPLLRSKRFGLIRNAIAVSYNQKLFCLSEHLYKIASGDTDVHLRSQSKYVLERLVPFSTGLDSMRLKNYLSRI